VLNATGRDINTLSPVLRSAWDGRPLALLTRTAPARASAPHLSVIGHITAAELAHHVAALDRSYGGLAMTSVDGRDLTALCRH
jgi:putative DNA primase/helicase